MPTTPDAIGFSNKWYPDGLKHAIQNTLLMKVTRYQFFVAIFYSSKIRSVLENAENLFEKLNDVSEN